MARVLMVSEECAKELASALAVTLPGEVSKPGAPVVREGYAAVIRPDGSQREYPTAASLAKKYNIEALGCWGYCSLLTQEKDAEGKPYMQQQTSPYPFSYEPISSLAGNMATYPEAADRIEYPDKWVKSSTSDNRPWVSSGSIVPPSETDVPISNE